MSATSLIHVLSSHVIPSTDYLATYYQACKDASSIRSAVLILTLALVSTPLLMAMGVSVTHTQAYRPQLWLAWCVYIAGTGSLITVRADSNVGMAVGLTVLLAFGSGIIYGEYNPLVIDAHLKLNNTFCQVVHSTLFSHHSLSLKMHMQSRSLLSVVHLLGYVKLAHILGPNTQLVYVHRSGVLP